VKVHDPPNWSFAQKQPRTAMQLNWSLKYEQSIVPWQLLVPEHPGTALHEFWS
jgi:hypothetical protein